MVFLTAWVFTVVIAVTVAPGEESTTNEFVLSLTVLQHLRTVVGPVVGRYGVRQRGANCSISALTVSAMPIASGKSY